MKKIKLAVLAFCAFACLPQAARADSKYSLGLEGFYDQYKEPDAGVDLQDNTAYGSITGSYEYDGRGYFTAIDGRVSAGQDNYSASGDGTSSGSPQYEGELRWRFGASTGGGRSAQFMPYTGIADRLFYDNSKNSVTTLGFYGYDRRIDQVYVPVGVTWKINMGSWIVTPTAEYDQLLWGYVNSRLQNAGGYNLQNTQHSGYGYRGEIMFGPNSYQSSWEIGPFARYWNIQDSSTYTDPSGQQWIEPHNTRLQMGLALRYLF